ncbi:MAG: polyprenyl synthetase family protein [candidate division Zixibacteria bacterium]|nr:polyprenyl synthetase family protein [candidate division Zixibacteria bacterium]
MTDNGFLNALTERREWVLEYLAEDRRKRLFAPQDIHDAVHSYVMAGGKVLRPCVLYFSCGAVGGDERMATPAAVAVELFHTWTLVHDDIIDRDVLRRGRPTVHEEFRLRALDRPGYTGGEAQHYGVSIGIMTGEIQHGWAISLFTDLYDPAKNNADVVIALIRRLETEVLLALVGGQTLDVQYSKASIADLSESAILDVLWRKTGALYQFAGMAGAMIGLNTPDTAHPFVHAVSTFTSECGIAFQLQDDILGLIGDEATLGKPVGSDIREGKRTTILSDAFHRATENQRLLMRNVVGNPSASDGDVQKVRELLIELGGVEHTRRLAGQRIEHAMSSLDALPSSIYKTRLEQWAEYLIGRSF